MRVRSPSWPPAWVSIVRGPANICPGTAWSSHSRGITEDLPLTHWGMGLLEWPFRSHRKHQTGTVPVSSTILRARSSRQSTPFASERLLSRISRVHGVVAQSEEHRYGIAKVDGS